MKASTLACNAPQMRSLPLLNLGASREEFLSYFDNSWALTEMLFEALVSEAAYAIRPYHQLRHPMIFYYGHPVSLYVNKLRLAGLLAEPVDDEYERLFETGVDEMRWDELHEKDYTWPSVAQVRAYRKKAYGIIRTIILTHPGLAEGHPQITQDSPLWALVMGFEHERIHFETSSVLMRELPPEHVKTPEGWPASIGRKSASVEKPKAGKDYPLNAMREMPKQKLRLGKPQDFPSFGWDNEYGSEERFADTFRASERLISNGEFYAFITDGGYHDEANWSQEGWQWRGFRNSKWPCFWISDGPAGLHRYKLRTCFEVIPMQWDWPVCVNFHEAKAYAVWKSRCDNTELPYRLLTEAEHNALRGESGDPVMQMSADRLPFNSNFASGSESPVDAYAANGKGFHDVFGNVWQWLEDHFHPLSGGKVHPLYSDFSEPCYDGEHQMILGGSFVSTGDLASVWARFHFRPHFFQHAGFRLSQSIEGPAGGRPKKLTRKNTSAYDTEPMLDTYMLMHWGSESDIFDKDIFKGFTKPDIEELPLACAALVRKHAKSFESALDLGCAVGRASFEMARDFNKVVGCDYSEIFVGAASALQKNGRLGYYKKCQGDEGRHMNAVVDAGIDRKRLSFLQADACAMPEDIGSFDAVLLANLLCRLREPSLCLNRLQGDNALVKRGGIAVFTTPLSWLEQYTPRDHWLPDADAIGRILTEFELVEKREVPFMIREHRRKFEYIVTQATVWRRK